MSELERMIYEQIKRVSIMGKTFYFFQYNWWHFHYS
jgi:hypothetical protein